MNRAERMQMQAVIIFFGIVFLIVLAIAAFFSRSGSKTQPQGEYIKVEDVGILTEAAGMQRVMNSVGGEFLTFGAILDGVEAIEELQELLAEMEEIYDVSHFILKKDWYKLYDEYLKVKGLEKQINRVNIISLGTGKQLKDDTGNFLPENVLITEDKEYEFMSPDFSDCRFMPITAYQKNGVLLTVIGQMEEEYQLSNVWVMDMLPEYMMFFQNNYEVRIDYTSPDGDNIFYDYNTEKMTNVSEKAREQVADIYFVNGRIKYVKPKLEKVNGKILSSDDREVTIDGVGTLPFSEKVKTYQIYDKLVTKNADDLRIGYNFTDFVIEDGKVVACLITRDEAMENIRVLINNSNYNGKFHETVKATVDTDFVVQYGMYEDLQQQEFKAGDVVEFGMDSAYFSGDRILIIPKALTGKIKLLSVERSQGNPNFRGIIEIRKVADGLTVINEVLLEEYLYCVVPSEMPASYPLEALKAQSICARTYAYRNMLNSGLSEYGAHLDDSTSFQVYNNINETVETNKAVRETKGQLLYYGDSLADTYYYSTSCGFGTTSDIWKSGVAAPDYLKSKRIGSVDSDSIYNETALMKEETFCAYIREGYESDYDSNEGWYRWNYMVGEIEPQVIAERMQTRQKANKNLILKRNKNDNYVTNEVALFEEIYNIISGQRGPGGVLDSLFIETDQGTYQVIGEYNIRYVLNNGESQVIKQDGVEVESPTLLPSAFMVMDVVKDGDVVKGYTITGGGYGHGVGMSQNGAKNMALEGMESSQILTFFYEGCMVKHVS